MDAPLRLGLGHPRHAVRPALVLEDAVGAAALDREREVALSDLERLLLEAAPFGIAAQHPVEVAREQARLLSPGARPDLDDHVLIVVRVGLDHREPDLLLELVETLLGRAQQLAQLGIVAVLGEQLAGPGCVIRGSPPLGGERMRRLQLPVRAPHIGVAALVTDHLGIGHLRGELREPILDLLDEAFDHTAEGTRPQPARSA